MLCKGNPLGKIPFNADKDDGLQGASHHLMLFHTAAFSNLVHDFVRKHI